MNSIVIVTKAPFGLRGVPIGPDGNLIMKYSSVMKKNLLERMQEDNIPCEVAVNNDEDLMALKRDGARLLLLSPYIKAYVDISGLDEDDYYFMTEEDFLNGYTDRIMSELKKLSWAAAG